MQRAIVLLAMIACGDRTPRLRNHHLALAMPTSSAIATQGATKISAASHTCAISDGRTTCWGYDHFRQLGNVARDWCNGLGCELAPCRLESPEPFDSVTTGEHTTCAIGKDGAVWCWGEGNVGQLGADPGGRRCGNELNAWPCTATPTKIAGLRDARSLAIGHHVCAALASGEVWCWGANDSGQLGSASTERCVPNLGQLPDQHGGKPAIRTETPALECSRVPLKVPGIGGAVQVAAGRHHTCALTASGNVLCWGDNGSGQLGLGSVARAEAPTRVRGLDGVVGIAAAMSTTCAWRSDGQALCWGANDSGQLGAPTQETCAHGLSCSRTPREVLTGAVSVGVGFTHSCARRRDGSVACWGLDTDEQLGSAGADTCGSTRQPCALLPQRVRGISRASALAVGHGFACAIVDDRIECWGRNALGSLGDGTTRNRKQPAPVSVARSCR